MIASSAGRSTWGLSNGDQIEVVSGVSGRRARRHRRTGNFEGWRQGQGAMMSNSLVTVRDLHKVFHRAANALTCCRVSISIFRRAISWRSWDRRVRQDDAAQPARRPRYADPRARSTSAAIASTRCRAAELSALAGAPHRLRLPAVQPAAGADGGAERGAAAAADEAVESRPSQARAGGALGRRPRPSA